MRGKIVQIEWQEDEATLKQLYLREKDALIKPRLHFLWLIRQGKQVKDATPLIGVHPRTAQQWLAWYREGGIEAVRQKRGGNYRGLPCRLSAQQCAALEAYSNDEGFATGLEAQKWIQEKFGVSYALDGVYTLLRRLKIKKKVPRPMNVKADEEVQQAYKKGD